MTTALVVLFFVATGLLVVMAAMRSGSRGPMLDSQRKGGRRAVFAIAGVALVLFGIAIPILVGVANDNAQAGAVDLNAREQEGRELFATKCSQCHILGASQTVQTVGPNLDVLRPPKELVLDAIEKGRARGQGQMPSLLYEGEEAQLVAEYVAKVAGRSDGTVDGTD